MPDLDLVALRTAAQEFSRQHLMECCTEMVELAKTGVLPQGRIRELGTMCAAFAGADGLKVAEGMVKYEAMAQVARGPAAMGGAIQRPLPPRGQPVELERWGKAAPDSGLLLQRQLDGYWTPWYIAQAALEAARVAPVAYEPVGGFLEDQGRWGKVSPEHAHDPDVVTLYRRAPDAARAPRVTEEQVAAARNVCWARRGDYSPSDAVIREMLGAALAAKEGGAC